MIDDDFDVLFPRGPAPEDASDVEAMDARFANAYPVFEDEYWRLSAVIKWIRDRTPEAVNGWSVDEQSLPGTLNEILQALRGAEIRAHARAGADPILREIRLPLGSLTSSAANTGAG